MSPAVEPTAATPPDWLAFARELAGAGWWADAVTAYEAALTARPAAEPQLDPGSGWQIRLLGQFVVRGTGGVVELGGLRPQHRALLQVLCLHAGQVVSDGRLCAWFWPDVGPERARHRLAVGVSALRSARGPVVQRESGGYRLRLDGGDTDVRQFERLLRRAHAAPSADRRGHLEQACMAWSGPLLPLAGDAEWVLDERDRLREAAVGAAVELAGRYVHDGQPREVVRVARAGLRIDRHSDRLWRHLVTALTTLGEPAAAATARREYSDVLVALGVPGTAPARVHRASA